eukprot:gene24651-10274_t
MFSEKREAPLSSQHADNSDSNSNTTSNSNNTSTGQESQKSVPARSAIGPLPSSHVTGNSHKTGYLQPRAIPPKRQSVWGIQDADVPHADVGTARKKVPSALIQPESTGRPRRMNSAGDDKENEDADVGTISKKLPLALIQPESTGQTRKMHSCGDDKENEARLCTRIKKATSMVKVSRIGHAMGISGSGVPAPGAGGIYIRMRQLDEGGLICLGLLPYSTLIASVSSTILNRASQDEHPSQQSPTDRYLRELVRPTCINHADALAFR